MTPEQSSPMQDFPTVLKVFWRWKFLFLALLLVPPIATYLIQRDKPKVYQSSALVSLSTDPASGGPSQQNLLAVTRLITTSATAKIAGRLLDPPGNPGALAGAVSASAETDTGFITITATDQDPQRAAAIAMAFASALSSKQRSVAVDDLDAQISSLREQIQALPAEDPLRSQLNQQVAQLRGQRETQGPGATIVEAAQPSATPVGPQVRRDVQIALVIGLLLAIGAVFAAESADRRLRMSDDLESITGLPLLGSIPKSAFSRRPAAAEHANEAFQMLRASLKHYNVNRSLSSVAVVSPEGQDGKTTVAIGLARAAAIAGMDVVLLDADVRLPQVTARLGLDEGPGLAGVLAEEQALDDVMVEIPLDAEGAGRLRVLQAGPPAPNPAALIGSPAMKRVVSDLQSRSDLLVVDTAAALAVGDALPLVQWVSGAVMVVRLNRSSRAAVQRLQKMIELSNGTVLGAVATGVGHGESYGYSYGQSYNRYARGRSWRRWWGLRGRPGRHGGASAEPAQGDAAEAGDDVGVPKAPKSVV